MDLTGASLKSANLRGADLRGARLGGAQLGKASLQGAQLSGANLTRADLSCADLTGSALTAATLDYAKLIDATLKGADLDGARAVSPYLMRVDLDGASLRAVHLVDFAGDPLWPVMGRGGDGRFHTTHLLAAIHAGFGHLSGVSLPGADLSDLRLTRGDRSYGPGFFGADLRGARLDGADLSGVGFEQARLAGATPLPLRWSAAWRPVEGGGFALCVTRAADDAPAVGYTPEALASALDQLTGGEAT